MLRPGNGQVNAGKEDGGISKRQLTLKHISDNVGGVKHFSSTLQHALNEERHFALAEEVPFQPRLAL
jgi:hypothetical protein